MVGLLATEAWLVHGVVPLASSWLLYLRQRAVAQKERALVVGTARWRVGQGGCTVLAAATDSLGLSKVNPEKSIDWAKPTE